VPVKIAVFGDGVNVRNAEVASPILAPSTITKSSNSRYSLSWRWRVSALRLNTATFACALRRCAHCGDELQWRIPCQPFAASSRRNL
jgi:hypothetical protein